MRRFRPWPAISMLGALAALPLGMPLPPAQAAVEEGSEETVRDVETLRACLAKAPKNERSCIGSVSEPCGKDAQGATPAVADCLDREALAWDKVLNERYADALAAAKEVDVRLAGGESAAPEEVGTAVVDSTRQAERNWIAFIKAECERLYDVNQEGTYKIAVRAACFRDLTAERAIVLGPDSPY